MPQKSNEFQKLVKFVSRSLSPLSAEVTESAMIDTRHGTREIDVLITHRSARCRLKIAVEAKDESRPMDMPRFEQFLGKYLVEGGLSVDRLIVCNRKGYSRNVKSRAAELGIQLLTLREAMQAEWTKIVDVGLGCVAVPSVQQVAIHPAIRPTSLSKQAFREGHVYCSHGTCHGTFTDFVNSKVREFVSEFPAALVDLRQDANKRGGAAIALEAAMDHEFWIEHGGKRHSLEKLRFSVSLGGELRDLKITAYDVARADGRGSKVLIGDAVMAGKKVRMRVSQPSRTVKHEPVEVDGKQSIWSFALPPTCSKCGKLKSQPHVIPLWVAPK